MKKLIHLLVMTLLAFNINLLTAEENKVEAGPQGGRLLNKEHPRAEFFVQKDRKVVITFYDKARQPVALTAQSATVIAEAPGGKTKLEFERKENSLISKTPLPEGNGYNVVVQLRDSAEAKPKNYRIPLDLEPCGGCPHAEYACTCH